MAGHATEDGGGEAPFLTEESEKSRSPSAKAAANMREKDSPKVPDLTGMSSPVATPNARRSDVLTPPIQNEPRKKVHTPIAAGRGAFATGNTIHFFTSQQEGRGRAISSGCFDTVVSTEQPYPRRRLDEFRLGGYLLTNFSRSNSSVSIRHITNNSNNKNANNLNTNVVTANINNVNSTIIKNSNGGSSAVPMRGGTPSISSQSTGVMQGRTAAPHDIEERKERIRQYLENRRAKKLLQAEEEAKQKKLNELKGKALASPRHRSYHAALLDSKGVKAAQSSHTAMVVDHLGRTVKRRCADESAVGVVVTPAVPVTSTQTNGDDTTVDASTRVAVDEEKRPAPPRLGPAPHRTQSVTIAMMTVRRARRRARPTQRADSLPPRRHRESQKKRLLPRSSRHDRKAEKLTVLSVLLCPWVRPPWRTTIAAISR